MIVQKIATNANQKSTSNIVGLAFDQYQGLRDYNEDRVITSLNVSILGKIYHIFGVFDGHGGSSTSEYLRNYFVQMFQQ